MITLEDVGMFVKICNLMCVLISLIVELDEMREMF